MEAGTYEHTGPILFGPQSGGILKKTYPELAENKKFKSLLSDEMLFVWYYANQSSPIDPELPDAIRSRTAASRCIKDPDKKERFINMDFPEAVKEAIEEMKKYSPETRAVAKRIIQASFANLQRLAAVNIDDFNYVDANGEERVDHAARKQYSDTVAKISETLPSLISQMEHGFGITDTKTGKENTERAIDKFHQHKKEA
jgi:hypothetical protein